MNQLINGKQVLATRKPPQKWLFSNGMMVEEVLVDKTLALTWLNASHPNQRRCDDNRARIYAEQMKQGKWRLTHQGICFDSNGFLIDGQHRLTAIVMADTPVRFIVFRESPDENMGKFDSGRLRTLYDQTKIFGVEDVNRDTVGMLKYYLLLERNSSNDTPPDLSSSFSVSVEDIATLNEEVGIAAKFALEACPRLKYQRHYGSTPMRLAAMLGYFWDQELTAEFFEQVAKGENLSDGMPSFALKSFIDRNQRDPLHRTRFFLLNCYALDRHLCRKSLKRASLGSVQCHKSADYTESGEKRWTSIEKSSWQFCKDSLEEKDFKLKKA